MITNESISVNQMMLTTETVVSSHVEPGMVSQYKNDTEQDMTQNRPMNTQNKEWHPSKHN